MSDARSNDVSPASDVWIDGLPTRAVPTGNR